MPVQLVGNRSDNNYVLKFVPSSWITDNNCAIATFAYERKKAIAYREEMLAYQKAAGKNGDREGARFFKEEAADALKWYRAACLLYGWVGPTPLPGDCPVRKPYEWPSELFSYLSILESIAETRNEFTCSHCQSIVWW